MEGIDEVAARKRVAELGRLLAAAGGYQVRTTTGGRLGRVEHVRYESQADRPDEIIVRASGLLGTRKRVYPLSAVRAVKPKEQIVVVAPPSGSAHSTERPEGAASADADQPDGGPLEHAEGN